jgi:hypothetical protein
MVPLQPDQPVAITLTAHEWNQVLEALHEPRYRLIQKIAAQAQPQAPPPPPLIKPNGSEAATTDTAAP